MKNISFLSENSQFLEVKFYIYLNRRVFVMLGPLTQSKDTVEYNHGKRPRSYFTICIITYCIM